MALTHMVDDKSGKANSRRQIFTFFIEDMMFGLDVENVLMLGQDVNSIQRLPIEEQGFCGVTKLQGAVVPVLDFAHRIGIQSGIDAKGKLLEMLTERERDHIEWINALEKSIKTNEAFTKTTDPHQCAFGKWYDKFETRDETLRDLLKAFDEPHKAIHNMGETLLHMRDSGKVDEALYELSHQRVTTLRRLRALFGRARDQIQSAMRPVLLFVTLDGKTPRYALLIDEINDVLNYDTSEFQASHQGSLGLIRKIEQVIDGIYTRANENDCLYFDINRITDVDQMLQKSGH